MKRKWIAAAAVTGSAVFIVMAFGEGNRPPPPATSSAEAVLTAEGSAADGGQPTGSGNAAVVDAVQQLIDELGIDAEDLRSAESNNNGAADNGAADDDSAEPATKAAITIDNFAFGQPVTVAPGATVEVKNLDTATHNVTATSSAFDTPNLATGESATFIAPDTAGRFEFTCTLHPEMTGTLIVEDSSGARNESSQGKGDRSSADRSNGTSSNGTRSSQPSGTSAPSGSSSNEGDAAEHGARGTSADHGSGNGY